MGIEDDLKIIRQDIRALSTYMQMCNAKLDSVGKLLIEKDSPRDRQDKEKKIKDTLVG